ncbi:MAG: hypothetical protein ABSA83_08570 [Verrucomicrobiota bacterium]|jgi:hypothetical protein
MKKTLTLVTLLAGAVAGYSQGVVVLSEATTGYLQAQIYGPGTATGANQVTVTYGGYQTTEYQGNSSTSTPAGSAVYTGGALSGTGFDAQIYGSSVAGDTLADLVPETAASGSSVLHFGTTATSEGFTKNAVDITMAGLPTGSTGTYAIAAWNTGGGVDTTLAEAQAAGEPWGFSTLGAVIPANPALGLPDDVTGFNIAVGSVVSSPEPSTIALGVMGISALLFRRRK